MTAVCVFCGSSAGGRPAYLHAARDLGSLLGRQSMRLVYGAANCGLMAAVADDLATRGTTKRSTSQIGDALLGRL